MSLTPIQRLSPNHDRRDAGIVDMVVLHYTGMPGAEEALARLCSFEAKVSAHYMVDQSGEIYQLVAEEERAWHAGRSHWRGADGVNDRSIGIEIVNPGHWFGYENFPDKQIKAVMALVSEIISRHPIKISDIVGHSDVAPDRKEDPGEKFPWEKLAEQNLALAQFSGDPYPETKLPDYDCCFTLLREIGYGVEKPNHASTVLAFQRRFCPQALGQGLDPTTRTAIKEIAKRTRENLTKD